MKEDFGFFRGVLNMLALYAIAAGVAVIVYFCTR